MTPSEVEAWKASHEGFPRLMEEIILPKIDPISAEVAAEEILRYNRIIVECLTSGNGETVSRCTAFALMMTRRLVNPPSKLTDGEIALLRGFAVSAHASASENLTKKRAREYANLLQHVVEQTRGRRPK